MNASEDEIYQGDVNDGNSHYIDFIEDNNVFIYDEQTFFCTLDSYLLFSEKSMSIKILIFYNVKENIYTFYTHFRK